MIRSSLGRVHRAFLAFAGAAALLAAAGSAQAEPTLLAPVPGATLATVRPTTSWSTPGSDTVTLLEFSHSSPVTGTGEFLDRTGFTGLTVVNLTAGSTLHVNAPDEQLYAGRWYWHVMSVDNVAGADEWSATSNFRIPDDVRVTQLTAHASRRGVSGSLKISANTMRIGISVRVKIGARQCMRKKYTGKLTRSEIKTPQTFNYVCRPGRLLAKGTLIKVAGTVSGGAVRKSKVRVVRV